MYWPDIIIIKVTILIQIVNIRMMLTVMVLMMIILIILIIIIGKNNNDNKCINYGKIHRYNNNWA